MKDYGVCRLRMTVLGVALAVLMGASTAFGSIQVLYNGCDVQSGDPNCAPLDFGTVGVGSAPTVLSLMCRNTGGTAITGLMLIVPEPNGFSAGTNQLSETIGGFQVDFFDIQLDTDVAGIKSGTVIIECNDLPDYEFEVIGRVLAPGEVSVELDGNDIADGSVTPIDLGTRFKGEDTPIFIFTVYNTGDAPLHVGTVVLPTGFTLLKDLTGVIDPCDSDTFMVQLDTSNIGVFTGDVSFINDDGGFSYGDYIDENPYNFPIQGAVVLNNDECSGAIPVVAQDTYFGTNVGATGAVGSSCGVNDVNDVWHSFTPEATHEYVIDLCGSDFDTVLAVYDSCDPDANELACNDEDDGVTGAGVCGVKPFESSVRLELEQGLTYYLRVSGYAGSPVGEAGDYVLTVTGPICTGPIAADLNNDCMTDMRDFALFASDWLRCNFDPPDACY